MDISRDQAADALKDIDAVAARSLALKGYAVGGPILIMWGLICVVGYGALAVSPVYGVIWTPLTLVGAVATFLMSRNASRRSATSSRIGARIGWTWLSLVIFSIAATAVLRPQEVNQFSAFPALLVALSYALIGIWTWPRYIVLGIAVAVATLFGYFLVASHFSLWMAVVMGGGLVLGGLWLRKA